MFTRVVELRAKQGKTNELCSAASEKVLPILKKQQGFQDEIVLVSNTDSNRVLAQSFWNKREDAERYQREQFSPQRCCVPCARASPWFQPST